MKTIPRNLARWICCASLLAGLAAAGCGRKEAAPAEPAPLARVGDAVITESDFAFEVRRRQETGRPLDEPQAILNDLIEREVMLQKARNSEILQDPAIRRELENKQLGQWLDRSLQVERDQVRVADDELRAHYDAHPETFTRPEMSRLAMLYRRTNPRDSEEARAALREELEQGRAAYLADSAAATSAGVSPGFGALAATYSEDPGSRYRGGDIGWFDGTADSSRQPAAVIEAGRTLDVGAVSEVISAGDGLYVVMKSDWRPAQRTSFEDVAPTLRRKLIRLKQEEVQRSFMSNLMAAAKIEINPDRASRLAMPAGVDPEPLVMLPVKEFAPNRE